MLKKVFYWNINKNNDSFINVLKSKSKGCDILLLVESFIDDDLIHKKLGLKRIQSKSDFDENQFTPKLYSRINCNLEHYSTNESKRFCLYLLQTNEYGEILIGTIHFPSKLEYDNQTQYELAQKYVNWLNDIEMQRGHKRTLVFGDFNMNPFELGMIKPTSFNATLSYDVAKKDEKRTFHFSKYEYFYNPMWNWLGDRRHNTGSKKIPGTYFYKTTSDIHQIYWNVFDKVIVRPNIIDIIDYSSLKVIEAIPESMLISGKSTKKNVKFTDHLPIVFNLEITTS